MHIVGSPQCYSFWDTQCRLILSMCAWKSYLSIIETLCFSMLTQGYGKIISVFRRILAVLSNAVFWIVSTHPLTSKSSRPFNNPLVIVPEEPITIGTIVIFLFHSFFNSLARSRYLSFFSHSFSIIIIICLLCLLAFLLYSHTNINVIYI